MSSSRRFPVVLLCCLALVGALTAGAVADGGLTTHTVADGGLTTHTVADGGHTTDGQPAPRDAQPANDVPSPSTAATAQTEDPWAELVQEEIDADSVTLIVDVTDSGDAQWQVVYRLRLETDADSQAFSELQADIENDSSQYLDSFEQRIRESVAAASNATGREMSASGFDVSTEREDQPQAEFGLVTFSYEWTGFAVADGDEIRVGDAIEQLFLDEDERIEFRWPEQYRLESSSPEPDVNEQQRAVYRGRFSFDAGQPELVVTSSSEDDSQLWLFAVAVGLIGIVAVAGLYWRRRRTDTSAGEDAHEAGDGPAAVARPGGGAADGAAENSLESTDPEGPPPELLSNEERLLRLLEQNGGRMKQKVAADELDWSAAKTSQVVGDLRDDGRVESFRLGRENVLTLPDVDIDETLSDDGDADGENSGGEDDGE